MKKQITIYEAVRLWMIDLDTRLAFFDLELYSFIEQLRETKSFDKQAVKGLRKNTNIKKKFIEVSDYLVDNKLVIKGYNNYFIIGKETPDELEIVCSLYNIGYISYLSAMRFYKITSKVSKNIDYIAPNRLAWKKLQTTKHEGNKRLVSPYPSENIEINKKYMSVYSRSHLYYPVFSGSNIRVISIGDLFLEMIRYPKVCGGFLHVLEVYEQVARDFLDEIISSTDSYGTDIDKCRVGFILNSYLDITDSRVLEWKAQSIARGGSRKMISDEPYSENYDAGWCISLNHNVFR